MSLHPNPVEADVCGAAEAFRRGTCNGIIGLGGGSALDVAKVCRLLIEDPGFALKDSKKLYEKAWNGLHPSSPFRRPQGPEARLDAAA